ncbi:MAG: TRAP transporter small permease [Pseudomonadota bacterium]|nr:TRAP transporter small permease [Pseudomonadota bacterium]
MNAFVARLERLLDILSTLALWTSGTCLVAMTAAITWQVFGRFVLNASPSWTEPLSLMLMLYFILLAAAVGVRERFHLGLDLLRHVAPARVNHWLDVASFAIVGAFGIAMVWYGSELMLGTWAALIPVLGVPEGLNHLPMVLSGVLIVLFSVEHLLVLAGFGSEAELETHLHHLDLTEIAE